MNTKPGGRDRICSNSICGRKLSEKEEVALCRQPIAEICVASLTHFRFVAI